MESSLLSRGSGTGYIISEPKSRIKISIMHILYTSLVYIGIGTHDRSSVRLLLYNIFISLVQTPSVNGCRCADVIELIISLLRNKFIT